LDINWIRSVICSLPDAGPTIQRIEKSVGPIGGYVSTLMGIQAAFEQAGIRFLDNEPGGGIGVRLMAPKA
jgi:hypothetical protein